jgi:hypothetical protein
MAAATLHTMSRGRFVLGLGTSTPQLAEGLHDTPFVVPLARMRRMVTQVPFLYPWSQLATGVERLREGAARGGHPDRVPIALTLEAFRPMLEPER